MSPPPTINQSELLQRLSHLLGSNLIAGHQLTEPLSEPRGMFTGQPLAIAHPVSRAEVVEIVKSCAAAKVSIVPQGGNTGLTGASMPDTAYQSLLLNLSRLDQIRSIDIDGDTLIAEAGSVVATIQQNAEQAGRLFPLSFAADGSAQIGGAISTNAGGTNVLRYGNTRELVRGLEVVLPDGELLDDLRGLRKDNTGYNLSNLFIGAEGTLGVITAASLKLFPLPRQRVTAWVAPVNIDQALKLLSSLQQLTNGAVSGCELLSSTAMEFVSRHLDIQLPLQDNPPWQLLLELTDPDQQRPLMTMLETTLTAALTEGSISDAVIAQNLRQGNEFWRLREAVSESQKYEGGSIKHDVALPLNRLAEFVSATLPLLAKQLPGVRPCVFGHLGDGNLHFNLSQPPGMETARFLDQWQSFNRLVHDQVDRFGGSISAEHGIGQLKKTELQHYKSPVALKLMQQVKRAIDPHNLMNPGKVLSDTESDSTPP